MNELTQHRVERAKVLAEEDQIELKNLPSAIVEAEPATQVLDSSNPSDLETLNKLHVLQTYERCEKNKTKTAKALGINRRSLYRLFEKFDIS